MLKSGWEVKYLEDVCEKIQDGSHYSPQHLYAEPAFDRYPYLTSKNIRNGYMKLDEIQYCTSDFHNSIYPRCNPVYGDVLLTKDGSNTGNVCLNTLHEPFSLLSSVCLLKPDRSKLIPEFLVYYIRSDAGFSQIMGKMTGAAIKRIILKTIKKSEIPLPPLPEQIRIVAILDEAFANISQAVANAEKNLANARELFDSYLNEVFTRKGEGWEETKLERLCSIKHGFAFKSEFFSDCGDYILLTPGSFYESGGYRERGEKTKYYTGEIPSDFILKKDDFLFAMTEQAIGLLGSSMIVPESNLFLHNQRLGLVQLKRDVVWDNDFFHHQFNTSQFRNAVQATASGLKVRHTSPSKLGEITVSFPTDIQEQNKIASTLNQIKLEVKELEDIYRRKLAALAELKQALLQKAFTGELTAADHPT
jgi:type I restriction enzyme S subunit